MGQTRWQKLEAESHIQGQGQREIECVNACVLPLQLTLSTANPYPGNDWCYTFLRLALPTSVNVSKTATALPPQVSFSYSLSLRLSSQVTLITKIQDHTLIFKVTSSLHVPFRL